jgi:hypothetical protein
VEDAVYEADVMFDDIRTAIENFAPEQVLEEFTEDFSGDTPFDAAAGEPQKRYDPFGVESFAFAADERPLRERVESFLGGFDLVENCSAKFARVDSYGGGALRGLTKWSIRGRAGEMLVKVSARFETIAVCGAGGWRIAFMRRTEGAVLRCARPVFRDVTARTGIRFPAGRACGDPAYAGTAASCHGCTYRTPFIQLGGLAVADYDGDGRVDFAVIRPGKNLLYRNLGGFRFEDVTERAGIGHGGFGASGLWLDYDNDGDLDLLTTSLCRHEEAEDDGAIHLYHNDGGVFREVTAEAGLVRHGAAFAAAAADYDGDGDLDVYVGFYGGTFRSAGELTYGPGTESYLDARNGEPNALFRNWGDGTFEEVGGELGVADTGWTLAVLFTDLDGDGAPDLYVVNDFGRNVLYLQRGGAFVDATESTGAADPGFGMGAAVADFDGDGRFDIYVSNMYSTAADRIIPRLPEELAVRLRKASRGNTLLHAGGSGRFEDVSGESGAGSAGWAWGCAVLDALNRGAADIYVANGFLTGLSRVDL